MARRDSRGIIIALSVMILVGICQWLPYGLVFLGRVISAPLSKDDTEMVQMLQARVADLEAELNMLQRLSRINASDNMLLASVQLGPGFVFSDSLLVSVGKAQGIREEDLVIMPGGIAIGTVAEVGGNWSKVALLSRLGSTVVLRGGAAKEIVFEARGAGGGELRAELPSAVIFHAGDLVWLGSHPMYIAGLIDAADRAPGRQLQQLTIRVPIAAELLRSVFIVRTASR